MALADLIRALERDAQAQAAACIDEARSRAAAVRVETERLVAARRRAVLGAEERRIRAEAVRKVVAARQHARRVTLHARERAIERIFSKAAALLAETSALESYRQALSARLEELLAYVGSHPASIVCPPALEASVQALLPERPGIRIRADAGAAPGVVAISDDGAFTVDNTVTARLQRLRPALEAELVKRLDARS